MWCSAQEHHLGPSEIPAKSTWALRAGWHSLFAPAQQGEGQGWRAGVAIFARPFVGLSMPRVGSHIVVPHRAVAACIEPPGYRMMTVVSLYLEDGKGVGQENLGHLSTVGNFLASQGEDVPFVVGGDYQASPDSVASTGFASHTNGEIVACGDPRGTCRSPQHASELDYFIVHKLMTVGVKTVATVEGAGTRPHVPVRLEFMPRLTTAKALILRMPPRLGTERIHGPLPPPPPWEKTAAIMRALVRRTREADFKIDKASREEYERHTKNGLTWRSWKWRLHQRETRSSRSTVPGGGAQC